jgi:RNA polymerase sigma-54 factor
MELKLQQRLTQQMIMTPQLQQAIKLLQMSSLELDVFIDTELLENPTLEASDDNDDSSGAPEQIPDENAPTADVPTMETVDDPALPPEPPVADVLISEVRPDSVSDPGERAALRDTEWEQYLDPYAAALPSAAGEGRDWEEGRSAESTMSRPESLTEHLEWQLRVSSAFTDPEREIASRLIGDLDDNGYLPTDIAVTVATEQNATTELVESVLLRVQELDPPGVGARTLVECLTAQVRVLGVTDPLVYTIIERFLALASKRHFTTIARETGRSLTEVEHAMKIIANLEPHPARSYSSEPPAEAIRPDIYLYRDGDEFSIVVDSSGKRKLHISPYYQDAIGAKGEARSYIQERISRARWLVRSIYHRERTLYKVMESLLRFQRPFFQSGDATTLRPLVLRDVADELGVNESTISRATSNKYVMSPHGLFALKFFFNTSIKREGEDDIASESVREHIRHLVSAEDERHPLSDQQIVTLLDEKGIKLARRTVAKYREMLNIKSSSERRRRT